jgi:hypothetical protein
MATEPNSAPDQIRAQVEALLAQLPDAATALSSATPDLDEVALRLEEAHEALVVALELVEKS